MNHKQELSKIGFPNAACELSCFTEKDTLELHAAERVFVFLKDKMTALVVAEAIENLSVLASELTLVLATDCGICNNCGDESPGVGQRKCRNNPDGWVAGCSLCADLLDESQCIHIPDDVLLEAGIAADAKLEANADENSGEIIVTKAKFQQDISDVPGDLLELLAGSGVCLAMLDELIMQERIIYGK